MVLETVKFLHGTTEHRWDTTWAMLVVYSTVSEIAIDRQFNLSSCLHPPTSEGDSKGNHTTKGEPDGVGFLGHQWSAHRLDGVFLKLILFALTCVKHNWPWPLTIFNTTMNECRYNTSTIAPVRYVQRLGAKS